MMELQATMTMNMNSLAITSGIQRSHELRTAWELYS